MDERAELDAALPSSIEVGELVHTGGTARVYSGRDRRRGVDVSVKVLDGDRRHLVETEGRALARLSGHPAILEPVAVGSVDGGSVDGGSVDGGIAWIVTDLAAGGALSEQAGSLTPEVLAWAAQLADALAYAHSKGVVHGDVKPANVLLDEQSRVRLADFGSAVLRDDGGAAPRRRGFTPRFASPERLGADAATEADDVYGIAATVGFLLVPGARLPSRARRVLQRAAGPPQRRPPARRVASLLERT
ncbi:MAG: serine/threonine-protein kinase [Microthrixaceae bacterium]